MIKSKRTKPDPEPTTDDAPNEILPWRMLDASEAVSQEANLLETRPQRRLIPFAQRVDNGLLACFDRTDGPTVRTVCVLAVKPDANVSETRYSGFGEWFDSAIDEREKKRR